MNGQKFQGGKRDDQHAQRTFCCDSDRRACGQYIGVRPEQPADGFREVGLFVAAVRVSDNVEGTTFEGLKVRLLGDDTTEPVALRDAIQDEAALSDTEASVAAGEAIQEANELVGPDPTGGTPAQDGTMPEAEVRCLKGDDGDSPPGSCREPFDSQSDGEVSEVRQ